MIQSSDKKLVRVQSAKEVQNKRKKQWVQQKIEGNKENLKVLKWQDRTLLSQRLDKMSQNDYRFEIIKFEKLI